MGRIFIFTGLNKAFALGIKDSGAIDYKSGTHATVKKGDILLFLKKECGSKKDSPKFLNMTQGWIGYDYWVDWEDTKRTLKKLD